MSSRLELNGEGATLRLASAHVPPLPAGEYCVEVRQTIGSPDKEGKRPEFVQQQRFHVAAPRMALSPQDLYAVYPPDGAVGDFQACLPQVVLSRRSLPWERSLRAADGSVDRSRPWMALLLFNRNDLAELKAESLDGLVRSVPAREVFEKSYPWERDSACRCLELPSDLFRRLAPRWEELPYLVHVRALSTADMDATGLADRDGSDGGDTVTMASTTGDEQAWLSVVVGNRLPDQGENLLCLVSLEGQEKWLGRLPVQEQGAEQPLRPVVLASSRFIHAPGGPTFHALAQALDAGPLRLAPKPAIGEAPNGDLAAALERGYTALRHHGRTGREMVSWYRGPLVPPVLDCPAAPRFHRSADAALRYDPELGILDVSYAVAWELGRLLGLRDRGFIEALAELRHGYLRRAAERLLQWDRHQQHVEALLRQYLGAPPAQDAQPPQGLWDWDARELLAEAAAQVRDSPLDGIPALIAAPLKRWFLLHDVPPDHLLPQPGLLPQEALRYFRLDLSWVAALFDGAMSWGRSPEARTILEQAMTGMLLRGLLDELEVPYEEAEHADGVDAPMLSGMFTGFMLRSEMVAGWPGLRLSAFDRQGARLRPLRIERITGDTMFCLYGGELGRIIIDEPLQGLHFRLQGENVRLRSESPGGASPGVVDMAALAKRLAAAGSHELARELLARPVRIDIHGIEGDR